MGITIRLNQTPAGTARPEAGRPLLEPKERLKLLRYCLARLRAWRSEYELYSSKAMVIETETNISPGAKTVAPKGGMEPAEQSTQESVPAREDMEMYTRDMRWTSSTTGLVQMTTGPAPHLASSIDTESIHGEMSTIYPTIIPSLGSKKPTTPATEAGGYTMQQEGKTPLPIRETEPAHTVRRSFEPLAGLAETKLAPLTPSVAKWRTPKVVGQILADGPEHWQGLAEGIAVRVKEAGLRTMIIASALRGEGATTVSVALAMAMTQHTDLKVVLVDGHFAHPGLASLLRVPARVGMEHHLRENVALADTLIGFEKSKLMVLPTLEAIDLPSIVLGAEKVAEVIERLSNSFDLVIIDQGSLFASRKPTMIPAAIDAALLVRDPAKSSPELLDQLDTYVARHHVSSLGVIENGVSETY
ncbi:hypothetical protein K2X85_15670 [bacterium]|nr:hypothetical protein [bacterium]